MNIYAWVLLCAFTVAALADWAAVAQRRMSPADWR